MNVTTKFLTLSLFTIICITEQKQQYRKIRTLVYPMGCTYKFNIGLAIPIKLGSKQQMLLTTNFQFQFMEPVKIEDLQQSWPILVGRSKRFKSSQRTTDDRDHIFLTLENILDRYNFDGRACLLRSICESSSYVIPHNNIDGLFGQLLTIMFRFRPTTNISSVYLDAQRAGQYGADCLTLYPRCSLTNTFINNV